MLGTTVVNKTEIGAPPVYDYRDTLDASLKVNWRIEDIIGGDKQLDFSKRFMPESLARVEQLSFLNDYEKRTLNQIRGNTYLTMFGIVEEFIVPFVLDHVRPTWDNDDYRSRALLQFVGEEVKHIQLFKVFCEEFRNNFGSVCRSIGPPSEIGKAILSHKPLGVALAILMIEWMSQAHFIDSVKDDTNIDPLFKSLLKNHWIEEAQHAKLDIRMVELIAEGMSPDEIEEGLDEFFEIGGFLDNGLKQQTEFDLESFELATGRTLTPTQREEFIKVQHQANRWTFIGSGMVHPKFRETIGRLGADELKRIDEAAPMFA